MELKTHSDKQDMTSMLSSSFLEMALQYVGLDDVVTAFTFVQAESEKQIRQTLYKADVDVQIESEDWTGSEDEFSFIPNFLIFLRGKPHNLNSVPKSLSDVGIQNSGLDLLGD